MGGLFYVTSKICTKLRLHWNGWVFLLRRGLDPVSWPMVIRASEQSATAFLFRGLEIFRQHGCAHKENPARQVRGSRLRTGFLQKQQGSGMPCQGHPARRIFCAQSQAGCGYCDYRRPHPEANSSKNSVHTRPPQALRVPLCAVNLLKKPPLN